ncbi:MAG TPA: NAD-dependent epimerase/dehydratase family protein [Pirellulales bacterium]|nr:NAD-dependent epimerase/dehydratase family protein [Pirellulales bacterium]
MMFIQDESQLDDRLSEPTREVVETIARASGDFAVLGVGGKMGPTLARMLRRALDAAGSRSRVFGISRFSSPTAREELHRHGIETIACDLLDESAVADLPEAPNVVSMTGRKFGSTGDEATTWAMNAYMPAVVCRKFRRSRIVAFSTGNVYGLTSVDSAGSRETDALQPVGEYAMSALARERMFEYFSRELAIPMAIIRLNYACELRYGVLVDIAQRIRSGAPVDLDIGHFNALWQGDANAMALRAFDHIATPLWTVNVAGPEHLSVRSVATRLGELMKRPIEFRGSEGPTALLSDARMGFERLGRPRVAADTLIEWVADWVSRGGRCLDKPTHFESREGRF